MCLILGMEEYTVTIKIYVKQDDFNCEIVNFPFPDGDVPRNTLYHVSYIYISQLIRYV